MSDISEPNVRMLMVWVVVIAMVATYLFIKARSDGGGE